MGLFPQKSTFHLSLMLSARVGEIAEEDGGYANGDMM
jgi:hypothetical protein